MERGFREPIEVFLADGLYGKPVVPTGWKEDRMSQTQDTIVAALMEQLIAEGPEGWHRCCMRGVRFVVSDDHAG